MLSRPSDYPPRFHEMTKPTEERKLKSASFQIADPFVWFTGQSEQRRAIAESLDELALSLDYLSEATDNAIKWLKFDLARLIEDEGSDLFPILRIRARKTDDFEGALIKLSDAHSVHMTLARRVVSKLEALSLIKHPATMDRDLTAHMKELATGLRNHSAALTAIVLPIARLRLRKQDLTILSRSIAARRVKI